MKKEIIIAIIILAVFVILPIFVFFTGSQLLLERTFLGFAYYIGLYTFKDDMPEIVKKSVKTFFNI